LHWDLSRWKHRESLKTVLNCHSKVLTRAWLCCITNMTNFILHLNLTFFMSLNLMENLPNSERHCRTKREKTSFTRKFRKSSLSRLCKLQWNGEFRLKAEQTLTRALNL
jgi:hypothetical protein